MGGNQVLATFARQATPTFNLTCLESGRAESSLARSLAAATAARNYVISGPNAAHPKGVFVAGAYVGFVEPKRCICMIGCREKKPEKTSAVGLQRLQPERGRESFSGAALYGGEDAQREE